MDEEQPKLKVTDRRLFNSDGSPRDLPPEEKREPRVMAEEPVAAPVTQPSQHEPITPVSGKSEPVASVAEELSEEDLVGAEDPASFVNFVMSIASNAASALGMM